MGAPLPAPDWDVFALPAPGALGRVFGGASRYTRQVAEAQAKHDAAMAQHAADESARQRALAAAKAEYDRSVIAERTRVARLNAQVAERHKGFAAGIPEAVEWFVSRVLERSRYPQGFPHAFQVAYRPENRDAVVEFELPLQKVVPPLRGYKYIKTRDAIDPLARPETEVKQRYKLLIARVALRTLHEIILLGRCGSRPSRGPGLRDLGRSGGAAGHPRRGFGAVLVRVSGGHRERLPSLPEGGRRVVPRG